MSSNRDPRFERIIKIIRGRYGHTASASTTLDILEALELELSPQPDAVRRTNIIKVLRDANPRSSDIAHRILDHLDDAPEPPHHLVKVAFRTFEHPVEAAAYTGNTYTYAAALDLQLTIGDTVYGAHGRSPATVVAFTDEPPPYGPSWIEGRA